MRNLLATTMGVFFLLISAPAFADAAPGGCNCGNNGPAGPGGGFGGTGGSGGAGGGGHGGMSAVGLPPGSTRVALHRASVDGTLCTVAASSSTTGSSALVLVLGLLVAVPLARRRAKKG